MRKRLLAALVSALSVWGVFAGTDLCVLDFGAKGDGVADDTAAFQAAADALAKANGEVTRPFERRYGAHDSVEGPTRRLVVPKGTYRLSGTVVFGRRTFVVGEPGATVVQSDPKADSFYCLAAYASRFENLTFRGGFSQIQVATHNTEAANVRVKGCRFVGANGPAVECTSYRVAGPRFGPDGRRIKATAVGEWRKNPATGRYERDPRIDGPLDFSNNSTFLMIEDSSFEDCQTATDITPDGAVIRNCRIVSRPSADGGALKVSNTCHAYGLDVTVRRNAACAKQCAVECLGRRLNLWLEDSSVRTDDGSGCPILLVAGAEKPRYIASLAVFENVEAEADGCRGVVHALGGRPPNLTGFIRVRNCGKPVPALTCDGSLSEDTLQRNLVSAWNSWKEAHSVALGDCTGLVAPTGLLARVVRPCPGYAGRDLVAVPAFPARKGPVLRAEDFGVDADPKTDDTAAMKRFVGKLCGTPDATGLVPAAVITVRETLDLAGAFALAGEGVSVLAGADGQTDVFRVRTGANVTLANLQLRGGRSQVVVESGAKAFVDSCFLYDPVKAAVVTQKGGEAYVDGGMSYSSCLYDGNGTASLAELWFRFLPTSADDEPFRPAAAIVNRGTLQAWDILGVPTVFRRWEKESMGDPRHPIVEFRWVDNYGDFASRGMRYGGEWGGMDYVFHFGKARTVVEAGYGAYSNTSSHQTPVVADTESPDVRFFAVAFQGRYNANQGVGVRWRPSPDAWPRPLVSTRFFDAVHPQPDDPVARARRLIAHCGHVDRSKTVARPPENTLASFDDAVAAGFGFECDLLYTKDKRVFTMHDGCFGRVYGIDNEDAASMTWDQVSKLVPRDSSGKAHPNTRAALFEEVCDRMDNTRWHFVELKAGGEIVPLVKKVLRGQKKANPNNLMFISFNPDAVRTVKKELPQYKALLLLYSRHAWPSQKELPDHSPYTAEQCLKALADCGADGLDFHYDGTIKEQGAAFVAQIRAAGYQFHYWVVDSAADMRQALANGAMTVMTNHAGQLIRR